MTNVSIRDRLSFLHPDSDDVKLNDEIREAHESPTRANTRPSLIELDQRLTVWMRDGESTENRQEAKIRILKCFEATINNPLGDDAATLELSGLNLKKLPDAIGYLTELRELDCENNQLSELPDTIHKLSELEILNCSCNQLITLTESVCNLTKLQTLQLHDNLITTLPNDIGNLTSLTGLICYNNQLTTLPDSMGNLSSLQNLHCHSNQLTTLPNTVENLTSLNVFTCEDNLLATLPRGLTQLPNTCLIDLSDNAIPLIVIEQLNEAIREAHAADPSRGPQIEHSLPAAPAPIQRSLGDEIMAWYTESSHEWRQTDSSTWQIAISNARLDGVSAQALSNLLGRLRLTAHYMHAPGDLRVRVHALLEQLKTNSEALAGCAAQAVEGTETCDDRIALAFFLMEEHLFIRQAFDLTTATDAPQKLRTIAVGLYKSETLRTIANKKADSIIGFLDRTEIILKYWVKLSAELGLPCQLQDMIFHRCARDVTDEDIHDARMQVRNAENDVPRFNHYLANWEPWQRILEHKLPIQYEQVQKNLAMFEQNCHEKLEKLHTELENLGATQGELSQPYLNLQTKINLIPKELQQYKTEQFIELSQRLNSNKRKRAEEQ